MTRIIIVLLLVLALVRSDDPTTTEQPIQKNTDEVTEKTVEANFSNGSVVSELQQAMCSVKTEDVVAKAQSTVTRILTGVCTSEELTRALKNLENTFLERLDQLQRDLSSLIRAKLQEQPVHHYHRKKIVKKPSPFRTVDYLFDENVFKNYT